MEQLDRGLIDDCVHCGFCLPACPTYVLWGEEMDSPRGRIYLMRELAEGAPLTPAVTEHFDRCLGCLACQTACPSGVRYGELIETTRSIVESNAKRTLSERLLRRSLYALFPYRRRLGYVVLLLGLYRRSGLSRLVRAVLRRVPGATARRLAALEELAPPTARTAPLPPLTRATGERRAVVGLLTGCVQSVFFGGVNEATLRVLAAAGCDVVVPSGQGCCGALSLHGGELRQAMTLARHTVDAFEAAGVETVVVNSAGCGSAMKDYGRLLAGDPAYAERAARLAGRVRDFAEFLAGHGGLPTGPLPSGPLPTVAAYLDACHLVHGQGVREAPRQLLRSVPGLQLRELPDAGTCCGSAGVYNVLQPDTAAELGRRKAAGVLATGADLLVTANPGCTLQLRRALAEAGRPLPVLHLAEVLAASIGVSAGGLPSGA
jgi:glycolate oxidase iron-sulfur subunit